jgi:ectoine hydroxylase-related dioxygenase (phytanoyl-CoA dioxygenase family)
MENYHFKKYKTNATHIKNKLDKYGVAIIPNILNTEEINQFKSSSWDYLEHITQKFDKPIKREDQTSWRSFKDLFTMHSMLMQHFGIGHSQFNWDIRQNPKVANIFSKIWDVNKKDLITSFDGASIHFPPEITNLGWYRGNDWFHCDQSFTRNDFECIQSWVTAYDVNPGDATLAFLEKSHKYHKDFGKHQKITDKKDWYKLNEDEIKYFIDKGCKKSYIKCPAGSIVFWDSRTIHCGRECMKERENPNFRLVSYVCMMPRKNTPQKIIEKRIKAFEDLRTTTHWANNIKLFGKIPRTYGKELQPIEAINPPVLTELGRRLVGYT